MSLNPFINGWYCVQSSRIRTSKKFTSSCPEVSCKKGVLKNFTKFTGKHLCQSFFIDVFAGPRHVTLLKKRLWNRCFLMEFCDIFKSALFYRTPPMAASRNCHRNGTDESELDQENSGNNYRAFLNLSIEIENM